MNGQLIFDEVTKTFYRGKIVYSTNGPGILGQRKGGGKKTKQNNNKKSLDLDLIPIQKITQNGAKIISA